MHDVGYLVPLYKGARLKLDGETYIVDGWDLHPSGSLKLKLVAGSKRKIIEFGESCPTASSLPTFVSWMNDTMENMP